MAVSKPPFVDHKYCMVTMKIALLKAVVEDDDVQVGNCGLQGIQTTVPISANGNWALGSPCEPPGFIPYREGWELG
jgi:hypothetical protein